MSALCKLKGKMREKDVTYRSMCKKLNMSLTSFNNKMNGVGTFNISEALTICNILDIEYEYIPIFFNLNVAISQHTG